MDLNDLLDIPSVPASRRDHYPFSKDMALAYRLQLAILLLNAACALWCVEPCHRLGLLFSFWLLFVLCENVYRNYPWREPLNVWMWHLYLGIPCFRMLLFICIILLLLFLTYVGTGCELDHPLMEASVAWLSGMAIWPLVRDRRRQEKSEEDYDQFSSIRPWLLMLPGPFGIIFAALHSPSLLILLAAFAASSMVGLFLHGLIADVWTVSSGTLMLGLFAILCCHRLPEDVRLTMAAWEEEEITYARRIENSLRIVKGNLRTAGLPSEGSARFDRLAIQVPLLLREVKILRKMSRTITESTARELKMLTTAEELVEFKKKTDNYGPYTSECCIS
ncbi:uncharacterized protein LOC129956904 isoform X2 [Argiope bruennichi]|uniref:uncharacterized protein LOC129956904 isoform X2 n=1 Tax=Argiope bruennichi TaxID=94029 RepID=UPI00249490A2|nr:uncharacterized protein LOC129956904 isoform X2 [Argiope bruennichi]